MTEDLAKLQQLLEGCAWVFARTMPHNPHHYTLRSKWECDEDFCWVARAIRQYGVVEPYKGRKYTVLYFGEYKYWTMGAPITPTPYNPRTDTTLINRKSALVE